MAQSVTESLYQAALAGDIDKADPILAGAAVGLNTADVNAVVQGTTPLHAAVISGNLKMVDLLLSHGADVNRLNDAGRAALHDAVRQMVSPDSSNPGQPDRAEQILDLLLSHGADPNLGPALWKELAVWDPGFAEERLPTLMNMLLARGLDVNRQDAVGKTLLHYACVRTYGEFSNAFIGQVIKAGGNAGVADAYGRTPLHIYARNVRAKAEVNRDTLKALQLAGGDINAKDRNGNTPLHAFCNSRKGTESRARVKRTIKALLAAGAEPNPKNRYGETPARLISADDPRKLPNDRQLVAQLLGDEQAENTDRPTTRDVVRTMIWMIKTGRNDDLQGMLARWGTPDAVEGGSDCTLLYHAVANNNPEAVEALLAAGATVDAPDAFGAAPLCYSMGAGEKRTRILARLLDAGADAKGRDMHGNTPMHNASNKVANDEDGRCFRQQLRLLKENGADINARNAVGRTPLMTMDLRHITHRGAVRALLAMGAHADVADMDGNTALHSGPPGDRQFGPTISAETAADLLAHGARPDHTNRHGDAPLHSYIDNITFNRDDLPLIDTILKGGADPNKQDANGRTPIQKTLDPGIEISLPGAQLLIGWGADPDSALDPLADLYAHDGIACAYRADRIIRRDGNLIKSSTRRELLELMINAGLDLNIRDQDGNTLLHSLAQAGAPAEDMQSLLSSKAECINARNSNGETPLMVYCRNQNKVRINGLECLLDAGAEVNAVDNQGKTAAKHLAEHSLYNVIAKRERELFLNYGADIPDQAQQRPRPRARTDNLR